MHESRNATDESLIRFYFRAFAANLAERSSYHSALTKLSGGQTLELDWRTFGPLPSPGTIHAATPSRSHVPAAT